MRHAPLYNVTTWVNMKWIDFSCWLCCVKTKSHRSIIFGGYTDVIVVTLYNNQYAPFLPEQLHSILTKSTQNVHYMANLFVKNICCIFILLQYQFLILDVLYSNLYENVYKKKVAVY